MLLEAIRTQRHRPCGLFALFVDIKKAYDRVHRTGLWVRLWQCGVQSKMWRVLRNLYEGVKSRIRINDADTDWFELAEGLRQGCVLSPLLYAIFINSLADVLKSAAHEQQVHGVRLSASDQLLLLLYADDIVLVVESLEDLQRMSDLLARHARQWRYEVNLKKTKYMSFSLPGLGAPKSGAARQSKPRASQHSQHCQEQRTQQTLLWDGREPVDKVPCYRYLGVLLSETLDWSKQRQAVYARTADAAEGARRKGIRHMHPRQAGYVWKALVRSCAEYAADVWTDPDDEWVELEHLQVDMARSILRIDRASGHQFAIGELGWMRMVTRRHLSRLRYIWRLLTMAPTRWPSRLFRIALGLDAGELLDPDWFDNAFVHCVPGTWTAATLRLVASLELDDQLVHLQQQHAATLLLNDEAARMQRQRALACTWDRTVLTALEAQDQRLWEKAMLSDGRMSALASLYTANDTDALTSPAKKKRVWELEAYLQNDNAYARRQQTLLRYGGHQLRLTRGRWEKIAREQRVCQLCQQRLVETQAQCTQQELAVRAPSGGRAPPGAALPRLRHGARTTPRPAGGVQGAWRVRAS